MTGTVIEGKKLEKSIQQKVMELCLTCQQAIHENIPTSWGLPQLHY